MIEKERKRERKKIERGERKINRQNIRIKLRRRGNIMVESSLEESKTSNKSSSDEDVVVL